MFPGMTFAILSRDPDFVADMTVALRASGGGVYVATSWAELTRLQHDVVFEMYVVDPVPGSVTSLCEAAT